MTLRLRLRLLGEVSLYIDGRPVEIGHARQRCVLAALAVDPNRPVSVDGLVERVWGERTPGRPRNALAGYVSRLRRLIQPAEGVSIVRGPGGYMLSVDPQAVDLYGFRALIARAHSAADMESALAGFEQALDLCQGEPFGALDTSWFDALRTALHAERLAAEMDRNDLALRLGRHLTLVGELSQRAAAHPLDERLAGQLILSLYRSGRQSEALHHYERLRLRLADELGADPSPPLQRLHRQILTADPTVASASRLAPAANGSIQASPVRLLGALPAVWNVEARNRIFTGRGDTLARLRAQLTGGGTAGVQALHGMGGVGKTQLAIEYAHRNASDYDLVWWLDAEQPALIAEQFAALGAAAGWIDRQVEVSAAVQVVHRQLRQRARWLLVFDNAEGPSSVRGWLPQGPGHVLITSRDPGWTELAAPVPVDVLTRAESAALLSLIVPGLSAEDAGRLARKLGDLPLALAQAAGVLADTGMSADEYLAELAEHTTQVLAQAVPESYPSSLPATVRMSVERLHHHDRTAIQVLHICSFLAAEPVPVYLFANAGLALRRSIGQLGRFGLARITTQGPVIHHLTQAIVRDHMDLQLANSARASAEAMVAAASPSRANDPQHWSRWEELMPHLLALRPATSTNSALRRAATMAVMYLMIRSSRQAAERFALELLTAWRESLGPDHVDTLAAATSLLCIYEVTDQYTKALPLGEDTLARCRRVLGDNDADTLRAAEAFALVLAALGRYEPARRLLEDTMLRAQHSHGEDHLMSLSIRGNLGNVLRELGHTDLAHTLHQDTLNRKRRVLGDDHPHTLSSADDLATDLRLLGEHQQARNLYEDALPRSRRVMGHGARLTMILARGLGATLLEIGLPEQARRHPESLPRSP